MNPDLELAKSLMSRAAQYGASDITANLLTRAAAAIERLTEEVESFRKAKTQKIVLADAEMANL